LLQKQAEMTLITSCYNRLRICPLIAGWVVVKLMCVELMFNNMQII